MKKNLLISLKLTVIIVILCAVLYPLVIAGLGKMAPGAGKGVTIIVNGRVVGYERIGQKFTYNKYFLGRPSAVDYNDAGSAVSNNCPSNPDYLHIVQDRIDSFLFHNPGIKKDQIPAYLVTASGSGLDPNISPVAAYIQAKRIATLRGLTEAQVTGLVDAHIEKAVFGPSVVHVLKLNIDLDKLK